MKHILIPNATAPLNIGDLAMLTSLIQLLRNSESDTRITVHSFEPQLYDTSIADELKPNLYYWAVFQNPSALTRIRRLVTLMFAYLYWRLQITPLMKARWFINNLIADFAKADMIVFVGGGYIRSQKGLTQSLNLLLVLFIFQFAKLFKVKKVVAPMSFGPFGHAWHEGISVKALNGFDTILLRENFSYQTLQKHNLPHIERGFDHALLLDSIEKEKRKQTKPIIGFTIRQWLEPAEQKQFEEDYKEALISVARSIDAIIQPVIQVDAKKFGDVDFDITKRLSKELTDLGLEVLPIHKVTGLQDAKKIYSSLDILLGMRMHSNILAATQGTPFMAIAYEYKTQGIAQDLGVEENAIDIKQVTRKALIKKLSEVYTNLSRIQKTMKNNLERIKKEETERWGTM